MVNAVSMRPPIPRGEEFARNHPIRCGWSGAQALRWAAQSAAGWPCGHRSRDERPRRTGGSRSRALDLILTGRPVGAEEALAIGLVNRVVEPGAALAGARALAAELAALPQTCLRHDLLSAREQWALPEREAMANELRHGLVSLSRESVAGAIRFAEGEGRHGA